MFYISIKTKFKGANMILFVLTQLLASDSLSLSDLESQIVSSNEASSSNDTTTKGKIFFADLLSIFEKSNSRRHTKKRKEILDDIHTNTNSEYWEKDLKEFVSEKFTKSKQYEKYNFDPNTLHYRLKGIKLTGGFLMRLKHLLEILESRLNELAPSPFAYSDIKTNLNLLLIFLNLNEKEIISELLNELSSNFAHIRMEDLNFRIVVDGMKCILLCNDDESVVYREITREVINKRYNVNVDVTDKDKELCVAKRNNEQDAGLEFSFKVNYENKNNTVAEPSSEEGTTSTNEMMFLFNLEIKRTIDASDYNIVPAVIGGCFRLCRK